MSEESKESGQTTGAAPKKSGSVVGRIVAWVVILVLVGMAYFEWQARNGYDKTVAALTEIVKKGDQGEATPYSKAKEKFVGNPLETETKDGRDKIVELKWKGIFKQYSLKLKVAGADPNDLLGIVTPEAPEENTQ